MLAAPGIHILPTPRWLEDGESMDRDRLTDWVTDRVASTFAMAWSSEGAALAAFAAKTDLKIGALATLAGMTREGFTRRFHRIVSMTPHAYRIGLRLNAARALLASDVSPAEAAADAGFADQSHLGRAAFARLRYVRSEGGTAILPAGEQ